ncbi:MAG: hypothetical protein IT450_11385 [Phycisphaerales bacterium]|nr:hypothetical protein [Phycisphaerales bacterium]
MLFELKRLPKDAIDRSLAKAERYRLLNEPAQAESIYRDVLACDPGHQPAIAGLVLALTDQFDQAAGSMDEPQSLLTRLTDPYERSYYGGIICERWGRAHAARYGVADAGLGWLREAMRLYDEAERHRPADNADAMLRWNACARTLNRAEPEHVGASSLRHARELPLE